MLSKKIAMDIGNHLVQLDFNNSQGVNEMLVLLENCFFEVGVGDDLGIFSFLVRAFDRIVAMDALVVARAISSNVNNGYVGESLKFTSSQEYLIEDLSTLLIETRGLLEPVIDPRSQREAVNLFSNILLDIRYNKPQGVVRALAKLLVLDGVGNFVDSISVILEHVDALPGVDESGVVFTDLSSLRVKLREVLSGGPFEALIVEVARG